MIPRSEIDRLDALDLAGVIARDLGPALRERNGHVYFRCPYHDDNDPSLDVCRAKNTAYCNPCGKSWRPIKWVMEFDRVDFRAACARLGAAGDIAPVTVADFPKVDKPYLPPPVQWQRCALKVMDECCAQLNASSEKAKRVRDYLLRRGLKRETLLKWRVGYNPKSMEINGLWVWAGITIPCFMGNDLWGIKIRLLPEHPFRCVACGEHLTQTGPCPKCGKKNKYRQVRGSEPALFGAHTLAHRRAVFGCEGEFDAMLAYQEGQLLGGVFTTTNGANKDWRPEWNQYLLDAERIITLYDNDESGASGAGKLKTLPLGGRVWASRVPEGKDVTDYHVRKGGNYLFEWMLSERWDALCSQFGGAPDHEAHIRERLQHVAPPNRLAIDFLSDLDELEETR
jgi:DNA primase